ncbi:ATP-dependent nuclease [Paractinoplanes atraurantiacus]|uniref:AAA domain-containing protein, putative AbiEii toxin, Type IV TA system n=1 Tax=Paractinoplanes atraurantiacus TaxID=1036182 RepID=A0A285EY80_9ACTN|nr:ATP-binding protein [Actinoplanes atraurantiacus]SNY03977.1 AAA domain-containing protein, putative AbiEii toxin, Type IV TA system [Actinoplanes atraurantiacus]
MIEGVKFVRYRGFERFQVKLSPDAILVGPNSAGKSTIIESLALAERCLRTARRRAPTLRVDLQDRKVKAFALPRPEVEGVDPVYYDFSREGTRVTVSWSTGAQLHLSWPGDDDGSQDGYYWLEHPDGWQPRANMVDQWYPAPTIVPVVTPLDPVEDLKNADYIRKLAGSRLASRHFRNHLWLMKKTGELQEFLDFAAPWIPEIDVREVVLDAGADRLGVFYNERRSRIPKELAWAGDGMQIWLQLLWHIYRAKDAPTIVLDEPEVYLHPDLQRRLIRLLDECEAQVILASHSSEVITEASPESVVWIDRSQRGGKRVSAPSKLAGIADGLGTNYNLALVRASRSRMVIAAESADIRLLRHLARVVGARAISTEDNVSFVPIRSFTAWASSDPLIWMAKDVLAEVPTFAVLLSSGGRPYEFDSKIAGELAGAGIECRIWPWRELLNSLLTSPVLSRASGSDPAVMAHRLADAIDAAADEAQQNFEVVRRAVGGSLDVEEVERVRTVSAQLVIDHLNQWLVPKGYRSLTPASIAKAARYADLPVEVSSALIALEDAL